MPEGCLFCPKVRSGLFVLLSFQGLSKLQNYLYNNTQNGGDAICFYLFSQDRDRGERRLIETHMHVCVCVHVLFIHVSVLFGVYRDGLIDIGMLCLDYHNQNTVLLSMSRLNL